MGEINWLAVVLGAAVFFVVGLVWYSVLFGRTWQRTTRGMRAPLQRANPLPFLLVIFLFDLIVAWVLAHQYAMTGAGPRAKMMIAVGFGAMLMTPATSIYHFLVRQPLQLLIISAGYFIVGMAAMGAVFVALG